MSKISELGHARARPNGPLRFASYWCTLQRCRGGRQHERS